MEFGVWDLAVVVVEAILYATTLCAAGGVFFLLYSADLLLSDEYHDIRRWVGLCTGGALLASMVHIAVLMGSMGNGAAGLLNGAMARMILQAGEGRATSVRIAGLLFMGATLLIDRRRTWALLGAMVAATSFMWIGHAWAARTGGLSMALLGLHLLGVAFWLGALVPLSYVAQSADLARVARTAVRFGNIAAVVVVMLLAAGLGLLSIFLNGLADLWTSNYGRTIVIKLGFVACLLSLAGFNKQRLTPRLFEGDSRAALSLKRSIRFETLLGGLILIVTAVLTTTSGPPSLGE